MSRSVAQVRMMVGGMSDLLVVAAMLVFIIGIPLFLFPEQTERLFAWTIASPLTAAFLGAAYWSSGVLEWVASREKRWVHARSAVPPVLLFTTLTLLVTLLHLDRFHLTVPDMVARFVAWVWVIVYATVPAIMGFLLIRQLRAPGGDAPRGAPLPQWVRVVTGAQAVVMLVLGAGLLLAPLSVAPVWPWALTVLTARAIGAWLVGLGIAAAQVVYENDYRRSRAALFSYAVLVVLQLLAIARYPGEVADSGARLWLYLLFLGSMALVAAGTMREAMRR